MNSFTKWNIPKINLKKNNMKNLIIKDRIVGSFEITKYHFEMVNGEPKIVISMVKVLDDAGKYIKFAKLESVIDYLSYYPVEFKNLGKEIIIPENTNFNDFDFNSDLFPIFYDGKYYHEKDCDEIFLDFYSCSEALTYDKSVYIGDGCFVYPDGSFNHDKEI